MVEILQTPNPILREQSRDVAIADINTADVQRVINDMKQALASERFGVAIAAPQIGEPVRIFIVAGHTIATRKGEEYDPQTHADRVYINPHIVRTSKKTVIGDEGCLSVPGKYGTKVTRYDKVTVQYYDEHGEHRERGASGFLARIVQHEIDHLDGMLYTDIAHEVIDVDDELKPIENYE